MFLIEKLEIEHFSNNEQIVVDFLLEKGLEIENMSTSSIAKETFVAKSTLVRIAKKMNFNGWIDFKTAFLEELNYNLRQKGQVDANLPFKKTDNIKQIANNIAKLEQESIEDTLSLIHYKDLQQAINRILSSNRVHIFAASNNLYLAKEFEHNMSRIQKEVRIHDTQGETVFNAFLAQEGDCAIVISYSGGTTSLLTAMSYLKKHHIPIILITSIGDNPSTLYAETILRIATKEKLYSKIATFSTDAAINFLFNILYSGVFSKEYNYNLKLRTDTARKVEVDRIASSKFLTED